MEITSIRSLHSVLWRHVEMDMVILYPFVMWLVFLNFRTAE